MARYSSLGKHNSSPISFRCSLVPSSSVNAENRERISPEETVKSGTPERAACQGDEIENPEPTNRSTNPLDWFGIFVPVALKRAQTNFRLAVSEEIPGLVNLIQEMQELEAKVVALRGEIEKSILRSGDCDLKLSK